MEGYLVLFLSYTEVGGRERSGEEVSGQGLWFYLFVGADGLHHVDYTDCVQYT